MTTNSSKPAPGWWAVPHNIGQDRKWALIPEDQVIACLGLYVATTGYCIAFESTTITHVELSRNIIIGAASSASVIEAAKHLLAAGIWTEIPDVGIDCGATTHIQAKTERIERARRGGEAKAARSIQGPHQDRQVTESGQE